MGRFLRPGVLAGHGANCRGWRSCVACGLLLRQHVQSWPQVQRRRRCGGALLHDGGQAGLCKRVVLLARRRQRLHLEQQPHRGGVILGKANQLQRELQPRPGLRCVLHRHRVGRRAPRPVHAVPTSRHSCLHACSDKQTRHRTMYCVQFGWLMQKLILWPEQILYSRRGQPYPPVISVLLRGRGNHRPFPVN